MIGTVLSLVVCLQAGGPASCETVLPDLAHQDGTPVSMFECLTTSGQDVARAWLADHPDYRLERIQCSMASDQAKLRERLAGPRV
jgi:hypothetical protein